MINDNLQECDDRVPFEERLQEAVAEAFTIGDNIHDECRSSDNWNEACFCDPVDEELPLDGNDGDEGGNVEFDPHPRRCCERIIQWCKIFNTCSHNSSSEFVYYTWSK
jgi:hypothetical protein